MNGHKGQILEQVVRKKYSKLSELASKLGISRQTLYRRFEDKDLDLDFIKAVGKIIHHDFSAEFEELRIEGVKSKDTSADKVKIIIELDGSEESIKKSIKLIRRLNKAIGEDSVQISDITNNNSKK